MRDSPCQVKIALKSAWAKDLRHPGMRICYNLRKARGGRRLQRPQRNLRGIGSRMEAMGMKLSEFQEKLTAVSDSKLRLMLSDSRRKGPEVAVKLILAEAERRGVDLNAVPEGSATGSGGPSAGEAQGRFGEGMPEDMPTAAEAHPGTEPGAAVPGEGLAAGKGAWLAEETNQGMPMFVKVLITAAVLAGILYGLFLLLARA